jgi:hypothetical protein
MRRRFTNDNENCIICNSNLDEKYADGIWDLAATICEDIIDDKEYECQENIYCLIREYIERQNYCPCCGVKRKE